MDKYNSCRFNEEIPKQIKSASIFTHVFLVITTMYVWDVTVASSSDIRWCPVSLELLWYAGKEFLRYRGNSVIPTGDTSFLLELEIYSRAEWVLWPTSPWNSETPFEWVISKNDTKEMGLDSYTSKNRFSFCGHNQRAEVKVKTIES